MKPRDWRPWRLGLTISMENSVGGRKTIGVGAAEVEVVLLLCVEWVWWGGWFEGRG